MNFTHKALIWYSKNKRDLPWRKTTNPYKIWLSEIILQQTRVAQGMNYYLKFIENYPTLSHLAHASEDQILKDWQGLGYYSRARNMHFTAKFILNELNGEFPSNYDDLLALKGIGEYTAAAIASFAFNQPKAVVDGNVFRILSRYFGIDSPIDSSHGKKEFKDLAQSLISNEQPAEYNQAIMELGALQCMPHNPDCDKCPFQDSCHAYNYGKIKELPYKAKKTKQRLRHFNYLVIQQKDKVFLKKRISKDIWQNLFDFPLIETEKAIETDELLRIIEEKQLFGKEKFHLIGSSVCYKHVLSHQKIHAVYTQLSIDDSCVVNDDGAFSINKEQLPDFAVPKLLDNYLKNESNLLYLL